MDSLHEANSETPQADSVGSTGAKGERKKRRRKKRVIVIEKKLGRERLLGAAYPDHIEIDPRQRPRVYMNSLIHEILHTINYNWPEWRVKQMAGILTEGLWDQRYRRVML